MESKYPPAPGIGSFFAEQQAARWHLTTDQGSACIIGHCFGSQSDREAAAAAALQGDVDALQTLPGNYTTIVQRGEERFAHIDPSGVYALYWRKSGDIASISDTGTRLGSEANPLYLAASTIDCPELVTGQSALQGVFKLEGGQAAYFPKTGEPVVRETSVVSDPDYTFEEATYALRRSLPGAVLSRMVLGKEATSDCSGGRDSTAVARLASMMSRGIFNAIIQHTQGTLAGDLPYAREMTRDDPHLRLREVEGGDEVLPFQSLENVTLPDEPDLGAVVNARLRQRLAAAKEYGSEIHMTGDGGDMVLSAPSVFIVGLAQNSEHERLRQACWERASVRYNAPADLRKYAYDYASRTLTDEWLDLAALLNRPGVAKDRPSPYDQGWFRWPGANLNLLKPSMRRKLSEQAERRAAEPAPDINIADYVTLSNLRTNGTALRHLQILARQAYDIDVHAPYIDKGVLEACLRLPAHERVKPGKFKPLSEAFDDMLPPAFFARVSKSMYGDELYRGLRASRKTITGLLSANPILADLGVIEPKAVLDEVARLDMSLTGAFSALNRIIGIELWLQQR